MWPRPEHYRKRTCSAEPVARLVLAAARYASLSRPASVCASTVTCENTRNLQLDLDCSGNADVSEFRHRILMQRPASPFVISNAVRGTWLGAGTPPSGGPDRRIRAAENRAGFSGCCTQIAQLWALMCRVDEPPAAAGALGGRSFLPAAGCLGVQEAVFWYRCSQG